MTDFDLNTSQLRSGNSGNPPRLFDYKRRNPASACGTPVAHDGLINSDLQGAIMNQPKFNPATRPTAVIGGGTLGWVLGVTLCHSAFELQFNAENTEIRRVRREDRSI